MINISKIREWETYISDAKHYDMYFCYYLTKNKIGNYLNTWFRSGLYIEDNILYRDSLTTLKKVDSETKYHLYNRPFNPLSIWIMPEHTSYREYALFVNKKSNKNKKPPVIKYTMKCHLHSVDDSSYGIWWNDFTIDELKSLRFKLMEWLEQFNTKNLLNGEALLNKCVELGADKDSKDYN